MDEAERRLLRNLIDNDKPSLEIERKYSDEFYDEYIRMYIPNNNKRLFYRIIKRVLDVIVSFTAIIVLLIPFIIIFVAIKIDSKGPAIFKSRRVGQNGEIFNCYKFRSMHVGAPVEVATSIGGVDKYITNVGRIIRKTSLDEMPQLINVLLGQMALIGYRPLVPTEVKCNRMREKLGVLKMKPGISGYAQVHGRDDVYYKNKVIFDSYYVKNANLCMDISIIANTIKVVIFRDGNKDKV